MNTIMNDISTLVPNNSGAHLITTLKQSFKVLSLSSYKNMMIISTCLQWFLERLEFI